MPMGVLNDDEFNNELVLYQPQTKVEIIEVVKGRNGSNAVPESLRKVIAEEGIAGSSNTELAKIFDVSESSVSAYKNGATSTASYNEPKTELKNHVDVIKDIITGKAKSRMLKALDSITDKKLEDAGAAVLAVTARHLSAVVKDMEPEKDQLDKNNAPQFVIFAPQMRDEKSFEIIKVKE